MKKWLVLSVVGVSLFVMILVVIVTTASYSSPTERIEDLNSFRHSWRDCFWDWIKEPELS